MSFAVSLYCRSTENESHSSHFDVNQINTSMYRHTRRCSLPPQLDIIEEGMRERGEGRNYFKKSWKVIMAGEGHVFR